MSDDPFATLGVDRSATVAELRAARRRLARELHPDRGGDPLRMQQVNAAFDAALAQLTAPTRPAPRRRPPRPRRQSPPPRPSRTYAPGARWEVAAFTIELPVPEAFEALLVVTTWIGELASDDRPRALEAVLTEPAPCWCRLELLPEGRATNVGIMVAGIDGDDDPPALTAVRDTWVAALNQLASWDALGAPD